ncbi:hypothetical protein FN846DRAFT_756144, partial [Sphaerosporella brunnea]
MLLVRLAHPKRLADLHLEFGWRPELVSRIAKEVIEKHGHLVNFLPNILRVTPNQTSEGLNEFVRYAKGVPLKNCWSFVETIRPIAQPTKRQRTTFNGHKRVHTLKCHAVVTPDGIVAHLFGPVERRRHDKYL